MGFCRSFGVGRRVFGFHKVEHLTTLRDALNELARAGDLSLPPEPPGRPVKREWQGESAPSHEISCSEEPSASSSHHENIRRPQPPAVPATPSAESYAIHSSDNYQYLPVRSEDLGRQPVPYEFNPQLPEMPSYSQLPSNSWNAAPGHAMPQAMNSSLDMGAQGHMGSSSDGFLRTLAAMSGGDSRDTSQQQGQYMAASGEYSAGENMLGMWSSMSGNIGSVRMIRVLVDIQLIGF
jgi:hypothetical protein